MKFTAAVALLGFGLNVAGQLATVEGVITAIQNKVDTFDSAAKSYTGGAPTALQSASDDVISTTNSGVTTVNGSADLDETDALGLTEPVQTLTTHITTAINDLIAKKAQIVAACAGAATLTDLNNQKTAASALATAITSKVPTSLQPIASQLSAGITAAIQKGIDAFTGTTCSSSSSGSGTGTATSSASGSASGSATGTATVTSVGSASGTATGTTIVVAPTTSGAATGTGSSPGGTTTGTSPPLFTNAAVVNNFNAPVGIVAALAALLAF